MPNFGASRQVQQAGNEIVDVLDSRDVQGLGIVAGSSFGGVIVAQEVADRVLPLIGMPRNPETATQFVTSGGVKTGLALGFGALAARMSGLTTVVSGFMGVGALASAGADFMNSLQRTGFFAEAPFGDSQSTGATMTVEGDSGNVSRPGISQPDAGASGQQPSRADLPY